MAVSRKGTLHPRRGHENAIGEYGIALLFL